jgi:ubiquinone/menaquinone biosynthesis C-methylase UbiE
MEIVTRGARSIYRFYRRRLFPRLMDLVLSNSTVAQYRRNLLQSVEGEVLEIGFGTGLNLPWYPEHVTHLTAIDPEPAGQAFVKRRIDRSAREVKIVQAAAESLPFESETFDCVVSTWTLCSIGRIDTGLSEIRRVLQPEGRFFFLEHGRSEKPRIQKMQDALTPINRWVSCGCHLNRDFEPILCEQGFELLEFERFRPTGFLRMVDSLYRGVATPVAP